MDMVEEDITNLWDLAPAKMEIDASKGMEWVMSIDELNVGGALCLFHFVFKSKCTYNQ